MTSFKLRGIVTFVSDTWDSEYMHLYTADGYEGDISAAMENCTEGVLKWIPKEEVFGLNLWEGDRIFLRYLLEEKGFFSLKLQYEGEKLVHDTCHKYE